jgi:diaminopimelate epimerase
MLLHFYKMNGAGNDFVVVDNRDLSLSLTRDQIALLCDRHRGVGADGLLAVEPAEDGADFKFRYYNADGGEAEMCGNGARCFGRFTAALMEDVPDRVTFETIAGMLAAEIVDEDIRIAMSDPIDLVMDSGASVPGLDATLHSVNTGVPHVVAFVEDLQGTAVFAHGRAIRHHERFAPKGTNANFAKVLAPGHIAIRTYERGVEDETLACGTGMVACALFHHMLHGAPSPVKVDVTSPSVSLRDDRSEASQCVEALESLRASGGCAHRLARPAPRRPQAACGTQAPRPADHRLEERQGRPREGLTTLPPRIFSASRLLQGWTFAPGSSLSLRHELPRHLHRPHHSVPRRRH